MPSQYLHLVSKGFIVLFAFYKRSIVTLLMGHWSLLRLTCTVLLCPICYKGFIVTGQVVRNAHYIETMFFFAGLVEVCLMHPLDVIKTRLVQSVHMTWGVCGSACGASVICNGVPNCV